MKKLILIALSIISATAYAGYESSTSSDPMSDEVKHISSILDNDAAARMTMHCRVGNPDYIGFSFSTANFLGDSNSGDYRNTTDIRIDKNKAHKITGFYGDKSYFPHSFYKKDNPVVAEMKAGSSVTIKLLTFRLEPSYHTFSLIGFTKAFDDLKAKCAN